MSELEKELVTSLKEAADVIADQLRRLGSDNPNDSPVYVKIQALLRRMGQA